MDGRETEIHIKQFKLDCLEAFRYIGSRNGVLFGGVEYEKKKPYDDMVPPVPDGCAERELTFLVASAKVVWTPSFGSPRPDSLFAAQLEPDDLRRLRKLTREAYTKAYKGKLPLTDAQADTLINELGPEAAVDSLRYGQIEPREWNRKEGYNGESVFIA